VARLPSGARALILVSSLAFVLGNCGAMRSCAALRPGPEPPPTLTTTHQNAAESAAYTAFSTELTTALLKPAHRRLASAANLAVSVLLVLAASVLLLRRQTGVWWLTQAALANVAWTIGDCVSFGVALRAAPNIDRAYLAYAAAAGQLPPETLRELARTGPGFTDVALVLYIAGACASGLLYAFLFWRVRRPDVAEVLAAPREE
jgi:hypothetical protein